MLKLAVTGASGRMGQRIVALGHAGDVFDVEAALEHEAHEQLGQDIGTIVGVGPMGIHLEHQINKKVDAMIDFSLPHSTECWLKYCGEHKIPLVVGTTGLSDEQVELLDETAKSIPIVFAANMSLGVNLVFKLVNQVAKILDDAYDIEVDETHHRFKRDAPSGTAMEIARQIADGKDWPFPDCLVHGREGGDCLREEKTIGMHAIRAGDTVGIHNATFSTLGETITLHHTAHSRDTFVRGALHAAQWVASQKPGRYSMFDVLGL